MKAHEKLRVVMSLMMECCEELQDENADKLRNLIDEINEIQDEIEYFDDEEDESSSEIIVYEDDEPGQNMRIIEDE